MGIKHFFIYYKNNFGSCITSLKKSEKVPKTIDNLLIDMNGIFHTSAQKIYEYGNFKPSERLVRKRKKKKYTLSHQIKVFEDICSTVENILNTVNPTKRLIMCVDGPAPLSKQCISKGTLVTLANGKTIPIENVKQGDMVAGWNGKGFTTSECLGNFYKGRKKTLLITTHSGKELLCTPDHRILVHTNGKIEWKEAENINVSNDSVIGSIEQPDFEPLVYKKDTVAPYVYTPIKSITQNKILNVYDIEVDKNHSFIANGICVHNCQQRQRRFRSAMEKKDDNSFDSNCITPGTKFMDFLTKYIDWFIRKKISTDPTWQKIDIIFSSEKVAGEGEHKALSIVRKYMNENESYCLHGLDADLIMLTCGSPASKFYILREDLYNYDNEFYFLDIEKTREKLVDHLRWDSKKFDYDPQTVISDFILMCFLVGNDFLPHIPNIEIIYGGITNMFDVYKNVCKSYGHLTIKTRNGIVFRPESLKIFFGTLSQYEKGGLEEKLMKKNNFFPDILLESHAEYKNFGYDLDIESYRKEYYKKKFPEDFQIKNICHSYLEGMQWVLSYYIEGVSNWKWYYPFHYAPFSKDLAEHITTFKFINYPFTTPTTPFLQLMSVLPPQSSCLMPSPLAKALVKPPLNKFCPDSIEIDLSGKRREWEGVVLLPIVDHEVVKNEYMKLLCYIDQKDLRRNRLGKSFVYSYIDNFYNFTSFYGDIEKCHVGTEIVDI